VTLPLPLAVLCSFLLMHYANVTSKRLCHWRGIAICHWSARRRRHCGSRKKRLPASRRCRYTRPRKSSGDRAPPRRSWWAGPTFFLHGHHPFLAFVPVFRVDRTGGQASFHPLAFAKNFCDGECKRPIALMLTPILCTLLLRGKFHS